MVEKPVVSETLALRHAQGERRVERLTRALILSLSKDARSAISAVTSPW